MKSRSFGRTHKSYFSAAHISRPIDPLLLLLLLIIISSFKFILAY